MCVKCETRPQAFAGKNKFRPLCQRCHDGRISAAKSHKNKKRGLRRHRYRQHKKIFCEMCNFIPIHPCQLDVDHKDGNRANDDPANLQTLCANCHRLKTQRNKDYISGAAKIDSILSPALM
jgi:hypothetical protein